jgi:hypothetical protein
MYTLFEIMTGDSNFEALARPLTFGLYQRSAFTVSFFFVSFIILTSMVMSNVVVAVLLDQFVAPPPAGLTDNEVTSFIDYLKEELSTKKSLEGIDASPIEGLGDDALSKLIERMEQRTERTEQYILRLEGKLDQLVNSSSHPEPPGPAAGGGGDCLEKCFLVRRAQRSQWKHSSFYAFTMRTAGWEPLRASLCPLMRTVITIRTVLQWNHSGHLSASSLSLDLLATQVAERRGGIAHRSAFGA